MGVRTTRSLTIAGDFGSLKFESGDDGAAGAMDVDSDLVADSAQTILGASGDGTFVGKGSASVTGDSITYTLPSVSDQVCQLQVRTQMREQPQSLTQQNWPLSTFQQWKVLQ